MRTKTQSIIFAVSAALCAAAAAPAAARGPSDVPTVAPKATGGGAASIDNKICMRETQSMTGTRIRGTVCKTRSQWEAEGFTVTTRAKRGQQR